MNVRLLEQGSGHVRGQPAAVKRPATDGASVDSRCNCHYYYDADGRRIGDVSDDPSDNPRVSYAEQLATKRNEPVDRRTLYRSFKPVSSADFDQNFEPINESYPAATASSYTIRGGEDLQAIAQSLWGDRAMWYLIAEANGLRGNENLQAGQVLVIPNKVTNIHNNAETFRPYNAGEAIGKIDPTLPSAPPPPTQAGDKGCGTLGTVIMVVIAVVVTYYTGGAASNAFAGAFGTTAGTAGGIATTAAGYAVGAAAGSVASQSAGVAMGNQQSISWNAVGQSAIAGAIGGGISAVNPGAAAGLTSTQAAAANAAIASGINMAIHNDWNWTLVLASAVGAGVGAAVGDGLNGTAFGRAVGVDGIKFAAGMAGGIAGAAASGERVRYDSVFANTLGSVIGSSINASLDRPSYSAEEMAGDYQRESNRFASAAAQNASGGGNEYAGATGGTGLSLRRESVDSWSRSVSSGIAAAARADTWVPASADVSNPSSGSFFSSPEVVARGVDGSGRAWADWSDGATTHAVPPRPAFETFSLPTEVQGAGLRTGSPGALGYLGGVAEMVLGGAYNQAVRIGGGLASIPYAISDGVDAAVAIQDAARANLGYTLKSDGATVILGRIAPVVSYVQDNAINPTRAFSEAYLGDGMTTVLGAGLQAGAEIYGTATGMRAAGNFATAALDSAFTGSVSGSRMAQLGALRIGDVGRTLSADQVAALNRLGVNAEAHAGFASGEVTAFRYPTAGGHDVYGFLQHQDGSLTSQLFSINNTAGGAPAAFRTFVSGSNDLAASLGLNSFELQGGSVINRDLANALASRGFTPKIVPVPDALGGGMQEVLSKTVPVKRPGN